MNLDDRYGFVSSGMPGGPQHGLPADIFNNVEGFEKPDVILTRNLTREQRLHLFHPPHFPEVFTDLAVEHLFELFHSRGISYTTFPEFHADT